MSKYKNGSYRLSVAGDKDFQNKTVLLADEKGADIIGGIKTSLQSKANSSTVSTKCDLSVVAPAFSKTSTYALGDLVIYNSKLHKCTTAVETAGNFKSDDWTETTIAALITELQPSTSTEPPSSEE